MTKLQHVLFGQEFLTFYLPVATSCTLLMILSEDDFPGPLPIRQVSKKHFLPSNKIYLFPTTQWDFFLESTYNLLFFSLIIGPTKSVLQAMLANLEGEDEMPHSAPAPPIINIPPPVRLSGSRATSEIPPIVSVSVPSSSSGAGTTTVDEPFESALGLGELASLTVSNEAEALSYEVSVNVICIPLNLYYNNLLETVLQAVTIFVTMASKNNIWRLNLQQKSPCGHVSNHSSLTCCDF